MTDTFCGTTKLVNWQFSKALAPMLCVFSPSRVYGGLIILVLFYISAFVLSFFLPEGFRTLAFDSGGVTTGPMTVPFIMSFGIGIAAIRSDRNAADDSFMESIMKEAGINTDAKAIVFSLPVTDTAGMRLLDELEME